MAKSSGSTTATQQPVGVNRRTLLRTGAHAAWAIPAVQIVTQSPALAATQGQESNVALQGVQNTAFVAGPGSGQTATRESTFSGSVLNTGAQNTTGLTVTLNFASSTKAPQSITGFVGWAATLSGSVVTLTSGTQAIAKGGPVGFSGQVRFLGSGNGNNPTGSYVVTASATNDPSNAVATDAL